MRLTNLWTTKLGNMLCNRVLYTTVSSCLCARVHLQFENGHADLHQTWHAYLVKPFISVSWKLSMTEEHR
jgi:hypothetical protein